MTFTLSKCPPKPKRIKKKENKSTRHENLEPVSLEEVSSILNESNWMPRRKRRRSDDAVIDLTILKTENSSSAVDWSVLDSPTMEAKLWRHEREKESDEKTNERLDPLTSAQAASVKIDIQEVDDDSDLENISFEPIFQKISTQNKASKIDKAEIETSAKSVNASKDPLVRNETSSPKGSGSRLFDVKVFPESAFAKNYNGSDEPEGASFDSNVPDKTGYPTVTTAQKKALPTPVAPPDLSTLFLSLDNLYLQADIHSVTVKDILVSLEAEFDVHLSKQLRRLVKTRLTDLIAGRVMPLVTSPPASFKGEPLQDLVRKVAAKSTLRESARRIQYESKPRPTKQTTKADGGLKRSKKATEAETEQSHHAEKPPKETNPQKARAATKHTQTTSKSNNEERPMATAPKQQRKHTRRGLCSLCTTCPCNNANVAGGVVVLQDSPRTTATEYEKSLIKRLKKLEKTVDKYESDLDLVTRELKRHRRNLLKKQHQEQTTLAFGDSRFLPDANVWDANLEQQHQRVFESEHKVRQTLVQVFGKRGGKATLTQIYGNGIMDNGEDEDAQQNETVENDCSFDVEEYDEIDGQENEADSFQRLRWRDGQRDGPTSVLSCWKHSRYTLEKESAWDRIFTTAYQEPSSVGFEELLSLFQKEEAAMLVSPEGSPEGAANFPPVRLSQLSQNAQGLASKIEGKVLGNPQRQAAIESACPNWRENVRFALLQSAEVDVKAALDKVQDSRCKLIKMKEAFLTSWKRQETVLQLYEMSLAVSLERTGTKMSEVGAFEAKNGTDFEDTATTAEVLNSDSEDEFTPLSQEVSAEGPGFMPRPSPVTSTFLQATQ